MIFVNLTGRTSNQLLEISYAFTKKRRNESLYVNVYEYSIESKTADNRDIKYLAKTLLNEKCKEEIIEFNSKYFYILCKTLSLIKSRLLSRMLKTHPHYSLDGLINFFGLRVIFGYHQKRSSFLNLDSIVDLSKVILIEATAVHVRLGDYLTSAHSNHNLSISDKIINALREDCNLCERPCYVFSDGDASEICEIISQMGVVCVDFSSFHRNDVETWFAMASCKHIYISNSSYSATAASILSSMKEIYGPTKWMKNYETPIDMLPKVKYYEV